MACQWQLLTSMPLLMALSQVFLLRCSEVTGDVVVLITVLSVAVVASLVLPLFKDSEACFNALHCKWLLFCLSSSVVLVLAPCMPWLFAVRPAMEKAS